jgi:hypothetical protein
MAKIESHKSLGVGVGSKTTDPRKREKEED